MDIDEVWAFLESKPTLRIFSKCSYFREKIKSPANCPTPNLPCPHFTRDSAVDNLDVENSAGLLKVQVIRGVNLAIRDLVRRSSDPYVILTLGHQRVRTKFVHQNCNPQWHEQLTLHLSKSDFTFHLDVFDHDTFSADDAMGEADIDLRPYINCYNKLKMNMRNSLLPQEGTLVSSVMPNNQNCLAAESHIVWKEYRLVQEMRLRLKNVECGEIDIEVALEGVSRRVSHQSRLND